ncbi:MAG TPA: CDP-alcohol phosphatidyltransferase family protein [Kofleriaceae bacterium]|nr:CDP-alcohol phosphatidyltransferase family protein [Kofleriaceae bacterium]
MTAVVIALSSGIEDGTAGVLGMPLLDRALLALRYGGVTRVTVLAPGAGDAARAIAARRDRGPLAVEVVEAAARVDGPLVLVAGDAVINQAAVREAIARAAGPGPALVGGADGGLLALPSGGQPARFDDALAAAGEPEHIAIPRYWVAVRRGRVGARRATSALLASCRKGLDSWWTRGFTRNVSLQITRLVAHTPITPNMVTTCALLCGLGCALLVYRATSHLDLVIAYALGQLGDIFDAADGETARVTYRFSRHGTWYDTICDDVCSLAVHSATGFALWNLYDHNVMAYAAWGGTACFALYVAVLYYNLVVHVRSGDAGAMRWWTTQETAQDAAAERIATDTKFDLTELLRTASNREVLLLFYLVAAAARALYVGAGIFAVVAVSLAFVSVGQIIKGYPEAV